MHAIKRGNLHAKFIMFKFIALERCNNHDAMLANTSLNIITQLRFNTVNTRVQRFLFTIYVHALNLTDTYNIFYTYTNRVL